MAFEKTLMAAKADSFEVVEGGFLMEEAHLNNIEAALAANETTVAEITAKVDVANAAQQTAEAALQAATGTVTAHEATINAQAAEIATLKAGPAAPITTTAKEGDDLGDGKEIVESEITKEANRLRALRSKK